uniref:Putative secreted protein n=2 Tax=Anopheles triannulatus TaxID=58253 RepID=A0A2M4AWF4_9DIPT
MLASVWNARPRGFFACLQILSSVSSVSACTNSTAGKVFETDQSSVSVGCIGNCSNVFAVAMSSSILNISFSSKQSPSLGVVALREDGLPVVPVRQHSSSGSSAVLSRSSAVSSHLALELSSIRYATISKSFVSSPASSDLSSSAAPSSCTPPSPALSSSAGLASREADVAAPSAGSSRSSESSCS